MRRAKETCDKRAEKKSGQHEPIGWGQASIGWMAFFLGSHATVADLGILDENENS